MPCSASPVWHLKQGIPPLVQCTSAGTPSFRPVYSALMREPWQPVQVRVNAWVALN